MYLKEPRLELPQLLLQEHHHLLQTKTKTIMVSSVLDTGTCTQIDTKPVHFAKFYSLCFADNEFADKAEEEELVEAQTKPQPKQ